MDIPLSLILGIIGIGSAALQMVAGRQYVDESLRMYGQAYASFLFTVLSRALNLALVVALFGMLLMVAPTKKRVAVQLAFGAMFFFFTNDLLGSIFGRYPSAFELPPVLALAAMVIALLFGRMSRNELVRLARSILRTMVLGSLLCAVVIPDWSYVSDSYVGAHRLIGLFNHPRALAMQAGGLFAIELFFSEGPRWRRAISILGALAAILMSVSKTTIALVPIIILIYAMAVLSERESGHSRVVRFFLALLAVGAIPVAGYSIYGSFIADNVSKLETLTGRSLIWSQIYSYWLEDPLLGNGTGYFSAVTRYANAHNIFLQSLSDGGLLGVFGLLVFLSLLLRVAIRSRSSDGWLGISLLTIVVFIGLSENVFAFENLYSGEFFVFLLVVLYLGATTALSPKVGAGGIPPLAMSTGHA